MVAEEDFLIRVNPELGGGERSKEKAAKMGSGDASDVMDAE